jgi:outer membrane lipoprotein-sorting protein
MPASSSIRRLVVALMVCSAVRLSAHGQTTPAAQQLLDSMIQALGGKVFLEVRDSHTKGRFFNFKRDQISASDLYNDYVKYPDMERTEFGREKETTVYINHGDQGWIVGPPPRKGDPEVQEQTAAQAEDFLKNFKTSFDYVVRFVLTASKTSVITTGSEVVDFKRADILEVRDAEKNLIRIFVDRQSRLPVKTQTRLANEAVLHEEILANWHRFDGVMTPLLLVRYKDGVKTMEIRTESVEYNAGLSDSLFSPPARAK